MECVYLKEAKYIKDFVVLLTFNDGKTGKVDLKDIVYKYDIASPLRIPENFSKFHLDSWPTLAWDCGFDVAPESLYERCESQSL
ncbi:MAG: DUF2442 domain-containing protein [Planctomycetota bacterium]|nr:DUF2442 domain-containing protein [Planctomycetota bacterium]